MGLAVVTVWAGASGVQASGATRHYSKIYVGTGLGLVPLDVCRSTEGDAGAGPSDDMCREFLDFDATTAQFTVTGYPYRVCARYSFYESFTGKELAVGAFCNQTTVSVPAGAHMFGVQVIGVGSVTGRITADLS